MSSALFVRRLAVLSAAFAAFLSVPAFAQTAPAPGTAPGLAPGQQQAPKQTREQVQDWVVRCLEPQAGQPKRCEMVQVLSDRNTKREVLVMVVGYTGEKAPQAVLVLPLGVLLPAGISLKIDQGAPKTIPYRHCEPQGCIAPWQMTEVDLAALRAGTTLTVSVNDGGGKAVDLPVSLKGFTAALGKLR
ncbi:invasion associated locus B family protein [Oceanibaculum indicum]|uniref:Invasion associated locus B family protein n=2 Tax=Oceanibaculum indicum TaxID=526216 RepID=K2J6P6_9PROT|nr:invasion associated locus B family protein [Oceanibaculum indicum]EKE78726.1 invasion associated locus B family protein [Oceanibaculum indicum P24]RKQ72591.1 invasion protein IalB [Oceanibaculum indicum]